MKRVRLGIGIVFLAVTIYCVISYGIFFNKKDGLDAQISSENFVHNNMIEDNPAVVIQALASKTCHECKNPVLKNDKKSDFMVTDDGDDQQLPIVVADNQQGFFVSTDRPKKSKKRDSSRKRDSSSFITMNPIPANYQIDEEIQDTLDVLIGNDVDEFVRLVLQSNNNIVSKEACRSCSIYAFFNGIKNHTLLTVEDIGILQKLLANLYRFVEKMQKLSKERLMLPEQYEALQDLHRSQDDKNDIKLKKRFAITSAALKKLQNITYNK
jgi:hypothetical protein